MSNKRVDPKYLQVFAALQRDIVSGRYVAGQKIPSEAALVQRFRTSRITIGRALRQLVQRGMVERRAGSGTYVRAQERADASRIFGLLIPNLGDTEIFEPICAGIAASLETETQALLWGNTSGNDDLAEGAWKLCQHYIAHRVSGVFFAPVEGSESALRVNERILEALDQSRIPTVLLDRSVLPYPRRGAHDMVSVDHRLAGFLAAEHLLAHGCERLYFAASHLSASSVDARIAGFREALLSRDMPVAPQLVWRGDPSRVETLMEPRPDGIVAANDRTAAKVMQSVLQLGFRVPLDVRIIGIDDLDYAALLPSPLTTVRQPCRSIGQAALLTMQERIANLSLPAREILLDCSLVLRQSCGC